MGISVYNVASESALARILDEAYTDQQLVFVEARSIKGCLAFEHGTTAARAARRKRLVDAGEILDFDEWAPMPHYLLDGPRTYTPESESDLFLFLEKAFADQQLVILEYAGLYYRLDYNAVMDVYAIEKWALRQPW